MMVLGACAVRKTDEGAMGMDRWTEKNDQSVMVLRRAVLLEKIPMLHQWPIDSKISKSLFIGLDTNFLGRFAKNSFSGCFSAGLFDPRVRFESQGPALFPMGFPVFWQSPNVVRVLGTGLRA
jgi:hypothetical protein